MTNQHVCIQILLWRWTDLLKSIFVADHWHHCALVCLFISVMQYVHCALCRVQGRVSEWHLIPGYFIFSLSSPGIFIPRFSSWIYLPLFPRFIYPRGWKIWGWKCGDESVTQSPSKMCPAAQEIFLLSDLQTWDILLLICPKKCLYYYFAVPFWGSWNPAPRY